MFSGYAAGSFYDEMFYSAGRARPHYARLFEKLDGMAATHFEERRKLADLSFLLQGITFTVYSDGRGTERLFPFDLIPRILPQSEWAHIERGLSQRVVALNLFLQDVYGPQLILKDRQILGVARLLLPPLPPRDDWPGSAAGHLHPYLRH